MRNKHCFVCQLELDHQSDNSSCSWRIAGSSCMATSEQNSQTHDHDNLDYSVPFSVFLCMQKGAALLLLLISALPKTSGSGVLLTQPASFALHALFASWPVRIVSSRIYLCFSANFKSSIVLTTTVSIASAMHSKALRQPNITLHYIYVYFMVQVLCIFGEHISATKSIKGTCCTRW